MEEQLLFVCRDRTALLYLAVLSDETPSHKTWLLTALSPRRFSLLRAGELDLYSAFADDERGQVYRARLPRTADGESTVEWVPSAELARKELPLVGERLDSEPLKPLKEGTTSPSRRVDSEEETVEPRDDTAMGQDDAEVLEGHSGRGMGGKETYAVSVANLSDKHH